MAKIDPKSLTLDSRKLLSLSIQDRISFFKTPEGQSYLASLSPIEYNKLISSYHQKQLAPLTSGSIGSAGGGAAGGGAQTATPTAPSGRPSAAPSGPSATPTPAGPQQPGRQQVRPAGPTAGADTRFAWEKRLEELAKQAKGQQQQQQQGQPQQQRVSNQYQRIPGGIDRTSKLNELKDPETRKLFATMLHAEVGGYGQADHQAFAEKVFNRAMIENKSLKQILSDKRYFEPYQNGAFRKAEQAVSKNPDLLNKHLGTIDRVGYTGIDSIKGATHNASGSVAAAVRGEKPHHKYGDFNSVKDSIVVVGRETFYSKTWEQQKIKNLPRISNVEQQISPGVSPEDAARTGTSGYVGTRTSQQRESQAVNPDGSLTIGLPDRIVQQAQQVATLGPNALSEWMKQQGYPKNRNWCGDFAASVIKASGGTPPKSASIASNWRNFGTKVDVPQPGDIAVRKGVRTGQTGSHVTVVESFDPNNPGRFRSIGGNQGSIRSRMSTDRYEFFRPPSTPVLSNQQLVDDAAKKDPTVIKPPAGYENLPEDIRNAINSLPDSRRNAAYENLRQFSETNPNWVESYTQTHREAIDQGANPQEVSKNIAETATVSPNAAASVAPGNLPQYDIWQDQKPGSIPTSKERQEIFNKGGVVVNLDTNWAKRGKQTGPLVVIPDNATKEQRKAAQDYVREIEQVYKEKFGKSLPGKVLTRSENSRGRTATMHTEPFSVNDDKAVDYFTNTEEGRNRLAQITSSTLGKIPGVTFSEPHNIYRPKKPDVGAVAERDKNITEVGIAKRLLDDMRKIREQQTQTPPVVPTQTQQPVSPGVSPQSAAETGSSGYRGPITSGQTAAPAVAPAAAPAPPAAAPAPPAAAPAPPAAAPAATEAAPVAETIPAEPTAEPVTTEKPPEYKYGGEQQLNPENQLDPENLSVIDNNTGEVQAKFNSSETAVFKQGRMEVTPASRDNSVGIEDRTNQILQQEQVVADQQTDQMEMTQRNSQLTQTFDSGYNKDWDAMMADLKSSSGGIYKNPTAARAYDGHRFAATGDVFKHFGFKTPTLKMV